VGDPGQDATTEADRIVAQDPAPQAQLAPAALAAAFLANSAGDRRPWPALFTTWAAERSLSASVAHAVRVAIIRERVFGAVERHRPRGRP